MDSFCGVGCETLRFLVSLGQIPGLLGPFQVEGFHGHRPRRTPVEDVVDRVQVMRVLGQGLASVPVPRGYVERRPVLEEESLLLAEAFAPGVSEVHDPGVVLGSRQHEAVLAGVAGVHSERRPLIPDGAVDLVDRTLEPEAQFSQSRDLKGDDERPPMVFDDSVLDHREPEPGALGDGEILLIHASSLAVAVKFICIDSTLFYSCQRRFRHLFLIH